MTNDPNRPRKVAAVLSSALAVYWSCVCLVLALAVAGVMLWIGANWHK